MGDITPEMSVDEVLVRSEVWTGQYVHLDYRALYGTMIDDASIGSPSWLHCMCGLEGPTMSIPIVISD